MEHAEPHVCLRLRVHDDVGDLGNGAPHPLLDRARTAMSVGERALAAEGEREEGDDPVVRSHEAHLARWGTGLGLDGLRDRRLVDDDLLAGRDLGERLEVRLDVRRLGNGREDLPFDELRDLVRLDERQVAGELQVQRDLDPVADLEHGQVVQLAHARDPERRRERALPDLAPGSARLDVDDDVGVGETSFQRILDAIRGRMALPDRGTRRDADDDVGEVRATRLADPEPPELDGRVELRDRRAGGGLGVLRRLIHEDADVSPDEPRRGSDHERGDEERRDGIAPGKAERGRREAGEDGERAREVAAEVECVREQRIAAIAAGGAGRDRRPRGVDRDDECDCGERPPGRIHLELDRTCEPRDCETGNDEADHDQEAGLGERGEVLGLPVAEGVPAIGGPHGDGDREERQQRRGKVGPGVRGLGEQAQARARDSGDELDDDEEARGPDRDERGAPLRRHARIVWRSNGVRFEVSEQPPYSPGVKVCPSCGRESAADARFCSACGGRFVDDVTMREERKVVTCLFCDLVGFTARAEHMDPEDVRHLLQPFHARVRSELERFGGTVEKFIGDAVMAIFGAPVAHEDDPERAVRAALAIRDALAEDGELEVRIGITTGEALVALDARPESGEGMASGDVVNTAARLQTAAPTNGILVDETTYRATERAVEYAEAVSVEAKGKAQPIVVREARRARALVAVERVGGAPLVGRAQELALLRETFARVVREREPQLVTLVGVPGIGKSRLVYELFQTIESGSFGLVFWRHGRSLPYGEGITFWALGEMVKAQAGILESDSSELAAEKLRQAIVRFMPDPADASWLERRLRPLAGLEADESVSDRRDESFAAWRRFLESIAEERPLVLVFEDLHWADDALLDFVDYLVDWARGVPLLVLCTARPELLARRSGWGGGRVNSSSILLSPLSGEETVRLLHALLGRPALDADLQARLLEHAGGNPLYAEEFTRMLSSRPGDVVLPETVQGIIAARLDTLPAEAKELLQDAAVIGSTFWLGALGGERWTLEDQLHALARKEFVTRNRRSSVAGEEEYAFQHALVRDVAYEQIPRAKRAGKHRAAAEWIESLGRVEDHAEMLAHHYASALEYARAAGQESVRLAERGRIALREAGDRTFALNAFTVAARHYALALELWPQDDPERPELLFQLARAYHVSGDERAAQALEDARAISLATGRLEHAAEADALLAEAAWYRRDRDSCDKYLDRAGAQVAELPDSPAKAFVLSQVARYRMLADGFDDAIRIGGEALAMAERLGLDELRAHALVNISTSRVYLGDEGGIPDLERAAELAISIRSPEAARALNNLGSAYASLGDLRRQGEFLAEAVRVGEELGALSLAKYARAFLAGYLFWAGGWDEGLRMSEAWLAADVGVEASSGELGILRNRAQVLLARDDVDGAVADIDRAVEGARQMREPQALCPALGAAAHVYVELGREEEARALGAELMEQLVSSADWRILEFSFVARRLGYAEELRTKIEQLPTTRLSAANLALVAGDFVRAADLFDEGGIAFAAADARRDAAEKLALEGRHDDAARQLELALAFYRPVRATRYIRRCEVLLAATSEVSA